MFHPTLLTNMTVQVGVSAGFPAEAAENCLVLYKNEPQVIHEVSV